jgi:transposase
LLQSTLLGQRQWKRLEPLLPGGRRGAHRVDESD